MHSQPIQSRRRAGRELRLRLSVYMDAEFLRRIQVYAAMRGLTDSGAGRMLMEERLRQVESGTSEAVA